MTKRKDDGEPAVIRHGVDGRSEIVGADAVIETGKKAPARQVRAAVSMKIAGASYEEIARVLEYTSAGSARAAVEQGLADAYEPGDTASLRRIVSNRLEGLWKLSWEGSKPTRPKLDEYGDARDDEFEYNPEASTYIRLAADVTSRYAKLHGLDAPTQLQVSPGALELEKTIQQLVSSTNRGLPSEADIFAEEVIDAVEVEEADDPDASA